MRKTPVVLGVLSIVFGSLTLLFCLLTPIARGQTGRIARAAPDRRVELEATNAGYDAMRGYELASSTTFGILSIALIVVGANLIRRRASARKATIVWAVIAIVAALVFDAYAELSVQPRRVEAELAVYATHHVPAPPHLNVARWRAIALLAVPFQLAYPLVLLALLGRRSATRDFLPAS